MNRFILICILCFSGGIAAGVMKSFFGLDYDYIACIIGVVIWANIVSDQIELDMDE